MEVLLGSPPPPPPAIVPDLDETRDAKDGKFISVAEQLAKHRASPACSSCHNVIDPIGPALDNFDVTGSWRIKDRGVLVNATGQSTTERRLAARRSPRRAGRAFGRVITHFTERLMPTRSAAGSSTYHMPMIRQIVRTQRRTNTDVVADPRDHEERGVPDGVGRKPRKPENRFSGKWARPESTENFQEISPEQI